MNSQLVDSQKNCWNKSFSERESVLDRSPYLISIVGRNENVSKTTLCFRGLILRKVIFLSIFGCRIRSLGEVFSVG